MEPLGRLGGGQKTVLRGGLILLRRGSCKEDYCMGCVEVIAYSPEVGSLPVNSQVNR